jgi:hypothetical protein
MKGGSTVRSNFMVVVLALSMSMALFSHTAHASDGVVEINQTCATSTSGCFSGDPSGFPVLITESGSYRLTSNLTIAGVDTVGIWITAQGVNVDLNGFTISGPNTFVVTGGCGNGSSALGSVAGSGIFSETNLASVRNGSVRKMGANGVILGRDSRIENVMAEGNCGDGLGVGGGSVVTGSLSRGNRLDGVDGSLSSQTFGGILVERSTFSGNGSMGVRMGPAGLAVNCVVAGNGDLGFSGASNSGVSGSVFTNNVGNVSGGLGVGCNMFNGTVICPP